MNDSEAKLPGARDLDQMTHWVPSNSVIPHAGFTTSVPLGSVNRHWSTESLRGRAIVGMGDMSIWGQRTAKGVGMGGGAATESCWRF